MIANNRAWLDTTTMLDEIQTHNRPNVTVRRKRLNSDSDNKELT